MPVPTQCQAQADEIAELTQERNDLQTELQSAPANRKGALATKSKNLNSQIGAKKRALNDCIARYGVHQPEPLASTFMGTATLITNPVTDGQPYSTEFVLGLVFDWSRAQVVVVGFQASPIDTTKGAPENPCIGTPFGEVCAFGPNITTITQDQNKDSKGGYLKGTGTLNLSLNLHFHHSRSFPGVPGDSDLTIDLSTTSPVTAAGAVTLSGSGAFSDGWLKGRNCTMEFKGTLTPVP